MATLHQKESAQTNGLFQVIRRTSSTPLAILSFLTGLFVLNILVVTSCTPEVMDIETGWSAPRAANGVVYVGTREGSVLALKSSQLVEGVPVELDSETLNPIWQFPQDPEDGLHAVYSNPLLTEEHLIISGLDGRVFLLSKEPADRAQYGTTPSPANVRQLFRTLGLNNRRFQEDEGRIFSTPAIDKNAVYIADNEGLVHKVNLSDQIREWVFRADRRFWSGPVLANEVVYIGSMDKRLYALDANTGALIWSFKAEGAIASTPLVLNDGVYIGSFDGKFYALDRTSGKELWHIEGDNWFWNDAIEQNGVIYVGSLGSTFFAINADTGTIKWTTDVQGAVRSRAVIQGDRIFVATRRGAIFGMSTETGQPIGRTFTPVEKKVLADLEIHNGKLLVHDLDQRLHVFNVAVQ